MDTEFEILVPQMYSLNVHKKFPSCIRNIFNLEGKEDIKDLKGISNDIVDNVVIEKTGGRYSFSGSVNGLSLLDMGGKNFVTPFYTLGSTNSMVVASNKLIPVGFDSFSDVDGLEDRIEDIRNLDNFDYSMKDLNVLLGINVLGLGTVYFTDLSNKNLCLGIFGTLLTGFGLAGLNNLREYSKQRNNLYGNLMDSILYQ